MTQRNAEAVAQESTNPLEERIEQLKQLFPEAVNEDGVDPEALVNLLGKEESRRERYRFTWAGKQEALLNLHRRTRATLKPALEDSVNWFSTGHLYIEGDNLQAMKLLYRSYFGRVKMIYIDPPYNTGNDFVYHDNFTDSLNHYLRLTGQLDDDGNLQTTDVDKEGRRHSNWLNMMYPRLFMARQLLRDDGVIFISIDDNEVHNLRKLMDEIFGEENFLSCFIWEGAIKNDSKYVSISHDYMLCYACNLIALKGNESKWRTRKAGIDAIYQQCEDLKSIHRSDYKSISLGLQKWYGRLKKSNPSWAHRHYSFVDENGIYFPGDISWPGGGGPNYDVIHPVTCRPVRVPRGGWRYAKQTTMEERISQNRIHFGEDETTIPNLKRYLHETEGQVLASVIYQDRRSASNRLRTLFGAKLFDNPKDENVLRKLVEAATNNNDIILDFFAGSSTTAHAVLQQNREDGGNRKFIMIQMPEPMEHPQFANIAEVGKERIRRVIRQMQADGEGALVGFQARPDEDLGFRVFKLGRSPRRQWPHLPADTTTREEYLRQMQLMIDDPLLEGWTLLDVVTDVALKEYGFSLSWRAEQIESDARQTIYKVMDDEQEQHFYICLDEKIAFDAVKHLDFRKEDRFVFRDSAITDTIIANLALTCRIKSI